ncbi:MAG: OmpA family protein, partial [Alloprevotella sp.]|nr:OmpA family protein [Alloprevotella sp.]
ELRAGLTYHFKSSNGEHYFTKVRPYDQAEVDGLNARINALRGEVADRDSRISDLENEVNDLRNRKPQVVEKIVEKVVEGKSTNALETAVYFQIGKSVIPASQLPSVERVAAYLKNHADSKVVIRGYASKDGPEELNVRLAENRAQAVKNLLVKKYGVAESRIDAAGNGISEMFSEAEWNRVSICTMEEK